MAVYLHDTFTDTDGVSVVSHTMDVGSGWTLRGVRTSDTPTTGSCQIASNGLKITNDANAVTADAGVADVEVSADFTARTGTTDRYAVMGRVGSSQGTGWDFSLREPEGDFRLREISGTTFVIRATSSQSWTAGVTYGVKGVFAGTSIKGYVNDVEKFSFTSSTYQANTRFGLGRATSSGSERIFDNFLVDDGGSGSPIEAALGQSSSSETTQALTVLNPREYATGQSGSVESASPLEVSQATVITAGQSSSYETTQALVVTNTRSYTLGQAASVESTSALEVAQAGAFTLGQSSSSEASQSLVVTNPRSYIIGQCSSIESVTVLDVTQANVQTIVVGQSFTIESTTPLTVSNPRTYTLGQSISNEDSVSLLATGGAVVATNQYIIQTIDGTYLLQTQS